ncbi:MAG: chemotaxis protein CheA [Syntrophales bacterium]
MENKELLEIFFSEAEDLLQKIEKSLLALEETPADPSLIQELFRAVHTMKSSAAMVGFDRLSEYIHILENLLDRLRKGQLPSSQSLISHLLNSQAVLRSWIEKLAKAEPISTSELENQKEKLTRFLGLDGKEKPADLSAPIKEKETTKKYYRISMVFNEDLFFSGQDPLLLLQELQDLGEIIKVEADVSNVPDLKELVPFSLYLSWKCLFAAQEPISTIEKVFCFVKEEHSIVIRDVTREFPEGIDRSLADKRIGEILLEEGLIKTEDLQEALQEQKKIGQVLLEKRMVTSEALSQIIAEQGKSRDFLRKSTIRVDTQKLDHMANLMEELSVNLSRVSHVLEEQGSLSSGILMEEMERLEQNIREMREQVMGVRMFPLEGTFQRLQRMVRDLAVEQGKEVKVGIQGAETELDKDLIEQITDPLKHLIRNAIDHGIESPAERMNSGKSSQGLLEINAFHREGKIFIQVRDDGRGLDEEAIYKKAVENNLIPPGKRPSSAEMHHLILLHGFSTARTVSEISGRGVGLDVVQEQVSRLGGLIDITSEAGLGTTITLRLPLTLAVLEGLMIGVGGESYLVPLSSVLAVREVRSKDIKTIEAQEEVLYFEDIYLPAVRLENVLKISGSQGNGHKIALILDSQRRRFALLADQLLDIRQVVIKGMETHFRSVPGVAGGAILGDGSVCLILDIYGLDHLIFGN